MVILQLELMTDSSELPKDHLDEHVPFGRTATQIEDADAGYPDAYQKDSDETGPSKRHQVPHDGGNDARNGEDDTGGYNDRPDVFFGGNCQLLLA